MSFEIILNITTLILIILIINSIIKNNEKAKRESKEYDEMRRHINNINDEIEDIIRFLKKRNIKYDKIIISHNANEYIKQWGRFYNLNLLYFDDFIKKYNLEQDYKNQLLYNKENFSCLHEKLTQLEMILKYYKNIKKGIKLI